MWKNWYAITHLWNLLSVSLSIYFVVLTFYLRQMAKNVLRRILRRSFWKNNNFYSKFTAFYDPLSVPLLKLLVSISSPRRMSFGLRVLMWDLFYRAWSRNSFLAAYFIFATSIICPKMFIAVIHRTASDTT